MYESFFGFKEKPFNITPDPKYLYLSEQHQEAIAHLLYGIQERGGFVVVTGEVGTGKTTLCRYLINQMDERTDGAIIFNPNLSEVELLKSINEDFGIISVGQTKKELIDELNQCLLEERLRGKNMVLIIDEAQNLQPVLLEQIRMLSNLETEKEKLIQIILIGQPQLKKLLGRPELKQLDQRITARYHLGPLSQRDIFQYIQHRLDVASNGNSITFEPDAMKLVYRFSKGIPRLVNVVCDRALLGAFAAGKGSPIPKKIVKQAIREISGRSFSFRERLSQWAAAQILMFLLMVFAFTLVVGAGWYVAGLPGIRQIGITKAELIPEPPLKSASNPPAPVDVAPEAKPPPSPAVDTNAPVLASPDVISPQQAAFRPEEEKKRFVDLLMSKSYEESRLNAMRSLLILWRKGPEPAVRDGESFYTLAVSHQLRCIEFWSNLDGLRCTNTPCILEMFVPQQVKPRYMTLAGLDSKTAKIYYADAEPVEVPIELLDEFWLRRAFVLWKDFEQIREILKPGDSGNHVVWLQTSLQTLGLFDGQLTGQYDDVTGEAVRTFQLRNNLLLDGIVGPRTKLALYANLKQYPMPRLNSEKT